MQRAVNGIPTPRRISLKRNKLENLLLLGNQTRNMILLNKGPPKQADMPILGKPRLAENTSATKSLNYSRFKLTKTL